jgi:protein-L-isoaspartate(D-aspartate) O-methyltransferase
MTPDPARLMRFVLGLRQQGVTDARILSAMERAPRSVFAPPAFAGVALDDVDVPIGFGEISPRPSQAARLLSAMQVGPGHKVLQIGAGCGALTGVLAHLCRHVVAVERQQDLVSLARAGLGALRVMNAHVYHGDGLMGRADEGPFDRIVLCGAAPPFIPRLIADLVDGGILAAPSGMAGDIRLRRFEKSEGRLVEREDFGPIAAAPLKPGLGG